MAEVSHMGESWTMVEDFLSLEHWREYQNQRSYGLAHGESLPSGNALEIPGSGESFSIYRPTSLRPGSTQQIVFHAQVDTPGPLPCSLQIAGNTWAGLLGNVVTAGGVHLEPGWSRVVATFQVPETWERAYVRLVSSGANRREGKLGRIRCIEVEDQA